MTSRRYVATFEPASVLGTLSYAATCELGAEEARRQVVVGDGAEWIKTEADLHYPQAVKLLDWPHLWRKIHAAIRAGHPGQSKKAREWRKGQYEQLSPRLWHGQVDAALAHLRALRPGGDGEPIDTLEEAITYVDNQREWIGNYQQWQEAGNPVGSAMPRAWCRRGDQSPHETTRHAKDSGKCDRRCGLTSTPPQCCMGANFYQTSGCGLAPDLWWNRPL